MEERAHLNVAPLRYTGPIAILMGDPLRARIQRGKSLDADPFGLLSDIDPDALSSPSLNIVAAPHNAYTYHDRCDECCGRLIKNSTEFNRICESCGTVAETDTTAECDDATAVSQTQPQLRIVGVGSSEMQPGFYSSSQGVSPETQQRQIYEEYKNYYRRCVERRGKPMPLDACKIAAQMYNVVQQHYVKRSQNKKSIMAACLFHACKSIGFVPNKADVAAFMELQCRGIAHGDNFVRRLAADGIIALDADDDPSLAEIQTVFMQLNIECTDRIRSAILDIVKTATDNNIGTGSILRSKIHAAAYVVLSRSFDAEPISIADFCKKVEIRKNTIDRFTKPLDDFHSYFVPCYHRAELDASPRTGRRKPLA